MKKMIIVLSLISSASVLADQSATWTCVGDTVKISAQAPYLGENSPYGQTLYTLSKKVGAEFNPSQYSAFFLSVKSKEAGENAVISGQNGKSGSFVLKISGIHDASDGTSIRDQGKGTLTYSHGPISGNAESVECVRE